MNHSLKSAVLLSTFSMTAVVPVLAQQAAPAPGIAMPMPMPMPGMPMHPIAGATGQTGADAEKSMMAAMEKMSQTMAEVPMTGNADRDFVAMMIPHHQGAIDMARFELAHGKDPAMLRLARGIVAAQDKEIAEMKAWQAKHPAAQ